MEPIKLLISSILIIGFIACNSDVENSSKSLTHTQIARDIIMQSGTCTLISLDSSGHPRARVMDPFPVDDDFVVWFGTNTKSRKVAEISADSRVVVHYYDKLQAAYVSIYGNADVITSEKHLKKYWKSSWQKFYPNYPDGYALIKVVPEHIELLSESHGILGDSITWKPAVISFE
jgi:general stress protein 26